MSARVAATGVSGRGARGAALGASLSVRAKLAPCGVLAGGRSSFHGSGVKIPPLFRDSGFFFPRLDANPLGKHGQAVCRGGSSVAMNALRATSDSRLQETTLVNGYALNHTTVSVHRLGYFGNIEKLNDFLQEDGIKLNSEGGILKVSPDGGLQQSSSIADKVTFTFAGGEVGQVPASYIEFAERLVLPIHGDLHGDQIHEWHRRDGFEVGNADKIFESTSSDQTGMRKC